jgi:prophage tail gpP-like protein
MTVESGRVALTIGSAVFNQWTKVSIVRDLHDLAGSFELELLDPGRLPGATVPPIRWGDACTVSIDGETVLTGYVDDTERDETDTSLRMMVKGRDYTGDLVDCMANPTGPTEYKGLTLLQITTALCAPFGIPVRADIDVGAPFTKFVINPCWTVLAAIEAGARQRSALTTSDGVGGLVLTRGGSTRAPWHLVRGENLHRLHEHISGRHRFSDIFVKGQSARGAGARTSGSAAANLSAAPNAAATPSPTIPGAGILMTGHAQDPEVKRWRPFVKMTRSQSGMTSVQEQAEWLVRVNKGRTVDLKYTVLDWRAGPPSGVGPAPQLGGLWRPNAVSAVYDPPAELNKDMLIAGVHYKMDEKGVVTELRVVDVTAYDQINEAARSRGAFGVPKVQPSVRGGR